MPDVPQFDLPFRLDAATGQPAVVEQDSLDDLAVAVEAACRTVVGERLELPRFGLPELALSREPLNLDLLVAQIEASEPRVRVLVQQAPETFNAIVNDLTVVVDRA